ncbi:hypothetical protein [Novosphingobium sp. G106]|uniref:hypothetical protein n=1 Tax=Novosphingobium sp. G106 TaxID=2849500 RepID=UPI0028118C9A|nr:hypothetical protein [Novosphingobium sp. G106]
MSEDCDHADPTIKTEAAAQAEARSAEAAAIRRRWITLGEALAVVAVVISALTLWNSWSERADTEATNRAEAQRASARAQTLVLTATRSSERMLALKPVSADQSVQAQSISFPKALGLAPVQTTGEPRVEAGWFADALKKARDNAGMPDDSRGDERLPVAITTQFLADGRTHEDIAIYDVGYTIAGRLLGGHTVALRGVSLVSHAKSGGAQATLDARWAKLLPSR